MKTDRHDSAKQSIGSIPQKDAIAIEPPKKVRRVAHQQTCCCCGSSSTRIALPGWHNRNGIPV